MNRFPILLSLLLVLLSFDSSFAAKKSSGLNKASSEYLRMNLLTGVGLISAIVTTHADEIAAKTSNLNIYRRALLWKIHSTTGIEGILAMNTVSPTYPDLWLYCEQMKQYFQTGEGKNDFGKHQPIAVKAAKLIVEKIEGILRHQLPEETFLESRKQIHAWAAKFPFKNGMFITEYNYEFVEWASRFNKKTGLGATVKRLDDRVGFLSDQISILNYNLLNRFRWQLELLIVDTFRTRNLGTTVENINAVCKIAQKIIPVTEEGLAPALENFSTFSEALLNLSTTVQKGDALIDHLFLRMLQLLLAAVAAVTLAVIIVKRIPPKKPAGG